MTTKSMLGSKCAGHVSREISLDCERKVRDLPEMLGLCSSMQKSCCLFKGVAKSATLNAITVGLTFGRVMTSSPGVMVSRDRSAPKRRLSDGWWTVVLLKGERRESLKSALARMQQTLERRQVIHTDSQFASDTN